MSENKTESKTEIVAPVPTESKEVAKPVTVTETPKKKRVYKKKTLTQEEKAERKMKEYLEINELVAQRILAEARQKQPEREDESEPQVEEYEVRPRPRVEEEEETAPPALRRQYADGRGYVQQREPTRTMNRPVARHDYSDDVVRERRYNVRFGGASVGNERVNQKNGGAIYFG